MGDKEEVLPAQLSLAVSINSVLNNFKLVIFNLGPEIDQTCLLVPSFVSKEIKIIITYVLTNSRCVVFVALFGAVGINGVYKKINLSFLAIDSRVQGSTH